MAYVRIYEITASASKEQVMLEALATLSDAVLALEGCSGVEIVVDEMAGSRLRFVERWTSRSAWEQSEAALPKSAFGPVMGAASQPPTAFAGITHPA